MLGGAQTVHSMVDFATIGSASVKVIPGVGVDFSPLRPDCANPPALAGGSLVARC